MYFSFELSLKSFLIKVFQTFYFYFFVNSKFNKQPNTLIKLLIKDIFYLKIVKIEFFLRLTKTTLDKKFNLNFFYYY